MPQFREDLLPYGHHIYKEGDEGSRWFGEVCEVADPECILHVTQECATAKDAERAVEEYCRAAQDYEQSHKWNIPGSDDVADKVMGLLRACGPNTIGEVCAELRVQCTPWGKMESYGRDICLGEVITYLIRVGRATLDVCLEDNTIALESTY